MSKPIPNDTLDSLIEELIAVWFDWMEHHNISNDIKLCSAIRRAAGEYCEEIQFKRQELIRRIDDLIESEWIK